MPSCSCYTEKGWVYIVIIALSSCQPSSCSECIKLNIYLSCNVYSISNCYGLRDTSGINNKTVKARPW
jgi:hypothetical protein